MYENNIQNIKYKNIFSKCSSLLFDPRLQQSGNHRAHRAHGIPLLVRRAVSAGQTADDPDDI